jgi:hypothetical protein
MLRGVAVVILAVLLAVAGLGGTLAEERVFLLFIDDLHLDFRSTPRLRELMTRQILPIVSRDGNLVGLVTTGYSSVAIKPTRDQGAALSGVRRIVGGGLPPDEILDPRGTGESFRRATIAIATARDAIKTMASVTAGHKAMIYISGGYGGQNVAADLLDLASEAYRAGVAIHAFEARGLAGAPGPAPSPVNDAAWQRYSRDAYDSLLRLADSTGGQMVSTPGEVDAAIAQMAR